MNQNKASYVTPSSLAKIPQVKGDKGTVMWNDAQELEEPCRLKLSHNPENTHTSLEWHLKLSAHGNNLETKTL